MTTNRRFNGLVSLTILVQVKKEVFVLSVLRIHMLFLLTPPGFEDDVKMKKYTNKVHAQTSSNSCV